MRAFPLLAALALALAAVSCSSGDEADAGRIDVVATTAQIAALTREVGGEHVDITTLIAPGVDAHDFDADPGDFRDVHDADLVLRHGIGLDDFLDDVIEGSGASKVVT